jgi:hypothetical protein
MRRGSREEQPASGMAASNLAIKFRLRLRFDRPWPQAAMLASAVWPDAEILPAQAPHPIDA